MKVNQKPKNTKQPLADSLDKNISEISNRFSHCADLRIKKVTLQDNSIGNFIYLEGLINIDLVQRDFMKPILSVNLDDLVNTDNINIPTASISKFNNMGDLVNSILSGNTIFLADSLNFALSSSTNKLPSRDISEPTTEKNVKGPHVGFVENLETNRALIRSRIKNTNLKFEEFEIGNITNQKLNIAYIKGLAGEDTLIYLKEKIKKIDIDGAFATGYIEQLTVEYPYSPFPQYLATERVDKAIPALLQGRLIVLLDGSPVVAIAPINFFSFFQAMDDYSTNSLVGSFLRLLRFLALINAIYLPSLYIAITAFHYYMVPLPLLGQIAQSRSRVPFTPLMEVLIMEIVIEFIREASIRLPTYIGTSIGVVGGIVIGQAAVEAGIVSGILVIVVAATAISSFVIPNYDMGMAVRYVRFIFMVFASQLGMIGVVICSVTLFIHLIIIESLGHPYLKPIITFDVSMFIDTIIRAPLKFFKKK